MDDSSNKPERLTPRKPTQKRGIATKDKILDAGISLINDIGFYKTNSKAIAKKAGCGIGTFYDYFSDKKELLLTALIQYRNKFFNRLQLPEAGSVKTEKDMIAVIQFFLSNVSVLHEQDNYVHNQAWLLRQTEPDVEKIMMEWENMTLLKIEEILTETEKFHQAKNFKATAEILFHSWEAVIHHIYSPGVQSDREILKEELEKMIISYLGIKIK